jgi:hypothetical protein
MNTPLSLGSFPHPSLCERSGWLATPISWPSKGSRRVSAASDKTENARGPHILKDRMLRPPS